MNEESPVKESQGEERQGKDEMVRRPFIVKPLDLGLPPGLTYDNVEELLEAIEGPEHR